MFDAVFTTPPTTTDGKVSPTVPVPPSDATLAATIAATAAGVAGEGVATLIRSPARAPLTRSTGATLMPVPPISTPIGDSLDIDLRWSR